MLWRVEVKDKQGIFDAIAEGLKKDIADLGIEGIKEVCFTRVYNLSGNIDKGGVERIARELLADRVIQDYSLRPGCEPATFNLNQNEFVIEVAYNSGVMDPVEESVLKGIRDLGIGQVSSVKTAKKYLLKGNLSSEQIKIISQKLLYNKLIQHIVVQSPQAQAGAPSAEEVKYKFTLKVVNLLEAHGRDLRRISNEGQLFLNLDQMQAIQKHFRKLKRNPTDCELETIAQTWSEHCAHNTFKGKIEYYEQLPQKHRAQKAEQSCPKLINNLLKSTIMRVTQELKKPWCVSVFKDNAGIIRFDNEYNICFKVETHNHPSALEPYGGANTGIGGVIRDVLGTGLGAKPLFNTDVFCFAVPDYPFSKLPAGVLHPKRIIKGVVSGVRDYGNKMGIPTVNGAVVFDERFIANPLVYCGTAGIQPKDKSAKGLKKGDLVVLVGGKTGRDGIHGATFSSGELTHESEVVSGGAVQIGNPIQEKKLLDTILRARDKNLYNAITDCGAGGLSSAVGEMGKELGARVDLEKVPLKYAGLSYTEIWISESQERMILGVPKRKVKKLLETFKAEDVEAQVIGEFTGSKKLQLYYAGQPVCDLDMDFLHNGAPQIIKKALFSLPRYKEPRLSCPADLTGSLFRVLSHYNVCSKEWIIRQYDHEVQAATVIKPLVGINNDGPSDAAVIRPRPDSKKGIIVSCGINSRFGYIDPYWMAASCIDEALRQIISVGGSLKRVALLDNFCWGNPDKPQRLGSLVRAAAACYRVARDFSVPFISGKDSLNNEYTIGGKSISIPPTLLISAIAVMENIEKALSMDLKRAGNLVYIVGLTQDELGGSIYFDTLGFVGNNVPHVNTTVAKKVFQALSQATSRRLISAIHDCSEGGLAVAAAEMAFSGGLGMDIFLSEVPYRPKNQKTKRAKGLRNDFILFSESNSRFIVEVEKKNQNKFEQVLKGLPFGLIGCVSREKTLRIYGLQNKVCLQAGLQHLKEEWQRPLRW
jgi:phosphoribosylformylglycinamidine synthase